MDFSISQLILSLFHPPQKAIPKKTIFPKANYDMIKGIPEKVDRPTLPFKTVLPSPNPWIGTHLNGASLDRHIVASKTYKLAYNQRKSKSYYNERGPNEQIAFEWRNRPWQEKRLHFQSNNGSAKSVSSRNPGVLFENNFFSTARGRHLPVY